MRKVRAALTLPVAATMTGLFIWLLATIAYAAGSGDSAPSVAETLWRWTPLMFLGPPGEFGGFVLNIAVSFLAMGVGTVLGVPVGLGQLSPNGVVRRLCWALTQLFRNSPWLVLLFYVMLLVPFEIKPFGQAILLPGWIKAAFALSLPIMANIGEITRGAVLSIPTGQWDSAASLGLGRWRTLRMVILPQCIKRMLPPWMNWYAILTVSTPLISILGINDAMTLTRDALAAEGRTENLIPMYLWLMSWFFVYCYPISVWTRRIERRFAVQG